MRRKNVILTIIIIVFIAVNIFLVAGDKSHKIDRVTFVSDWTEAEQKELQETMHKEGVLDYAFENYIYLDESLGSFDEFLVEEGDPVQAGDDLYAYDVHQPYELLLQLEQREDELTDSIQAIEQAIRDIESTDITQHEFSFYYPDDTEAGTIQQNVSNAQMVKEQYRIEKEKELGEKEAELNSVQTQAEDLRTGEETITVESPYDGRVTQIDTSLDNPVMTIEELELYAVGELTEKERMDVETGMLTEVTLQENDQQFDGSIVEIDDDPKKLELNGKSIYPFAVQLDESTDEEEDLEEDTDMLDEDEHMDENLEDEQDGIDLEDQSAEEDQADDESEEDESEDKFAKDDLLQGYHTDVKVILDDNPEATAVPGALVKSDKIWLMSKDGELLHKPVETGITDDSGDVEITSEAVEVGDWLAVKPRRQFRDESEFITPLKPGKTNWKAIYEDGARKRSILIGLLGR